jgi:hypothetical protein
MGAATGEWVREGVDRREGSGGKERMALPGPEERERVCGKF